MLAERETGMNWIKIHLYYSSLKYRNKKPWVVILPRQLKLKSSLDSQHILKLVIIYFIKRDTFYVHRNKRSLSRHSEGWMLSKSWGARMITCLAGQGPHQPVPLPSVRGTPSSDYMQVW